MAEELVPQSHGGAIKQGGNAGNKGGGRIPSHIRTLCREGFAAAVPAHCKIAKGQKVGTREAPTYPEMRGSFEAIGRYGMGELQAVALESGEWMPLVAQAVATFLLGRGMTEADFEECWRMVMDMLDSTK